MQLESIASELWAVRVAQKTFGLALGARMCVVRGEGGALLLHSPVALPEAAWREVQALGEIRFAVGPNRFHHLQLGPVAARFPDAKLLGAPGLAKKRADLSFAGIFGEMPLEGFTETCETIVLEGMPGLNEVALLHRPSRTLIVTDAVFHFPSAPMLTQLYLRLSGGYARPACMPLVRLAVKDRARARASIDRLLAWDFDRLVMAHGEVIAVGGKEALRSAWSWL